MDYGISHFYCFQNDMIENSILAMPDGCIDILFCCDEKEPYATMCGTVLHPKVVRNKKTYFFGVRFLPGLSLKFKDVTMSDFVETEIPLLDVINDKDLFVILTEYFRNSLEYHQKCFVNKCDFSIF